MSVWRDTMSSEENHLLYGNPFLLAMQYYISDVTYTTESSRRVDAVHTVMREMVDDDSAEYANLFINILSDRVMKFFPEKVSLSLVPGAYNKPTEAHFIYIFAGRSDTTEKEFMLVLERAALLWEEVDGRSDEIQLGPSKPSQTKTTNLDYTKTIEIVSDMLAILIDSRVYIHESRQGLQIQIPAEINRDVFRAQSAVPTAKTVAEFIKDFPAPNGGWDFTFRMITNEIRKLHLNPIFVFDNPIADFSVRDDVDEDVFLMILEETIKTAESKIVPEVPGYTGNQMSDIPYHYVPDWEYYGC